MANSFPQLRAAAIDGRTHNIWYRLTQLEQLHSALVERWVDIRQAIAEDYGHSSSEIAVELHLALAAVKRDYASLQPAEARENEYLIAAGSDAPAHRRPAGIVYIKPCRTHTMFYSVVAPLSAALAAGNCVIVLLEKDLRALPSVLQQILLSALDRDTFAIASSALQDQDLPSSAVHVDQDNNEQWPKANVLASAASMRTVAVVDRTANIQSAAHELVAARFSFGGRSPYAPDCVFVNEFVKDAFVQAVASECAKLGTGTATNGHAKGKNPASDKVREHIASLKQASPGMRVVLQEQDMAVVDIPSRTPDLLTRRTNLPVLVVYAVRSLDDVIDLISNTRDTQCLAAYHFSNSATGKYLSQFIDARLSFINNIPRNILVGPAFPTAQPIDVAVRYPAELFSVQSPAFVKPQPSTAVYDAAIASPDGGAAHKLREEATAPLALTKRSGGGGVGFFEQGFLLNAALILTTTISMSGFGIYWWRFHGWPRS